MRLVVAAALLVARKAIGVAWPHPLRAAASWDGSAARADALMASRGGRRVVQPPWVCTSIYHENGGWYSRPAKREIYACSTVAAGGEHYLVTCGRNRTTVYAVTADNEPEEDGLVLLRCYVDDDPKEDYWTVTATVDDETGDVWVAVAGERQLIKIINATAGGGGGGGGGGSASSPDVLRVDDDTSDEEEGGSSGGGDVAGYTGGEGACLEDDEPPCFWYLQGEAGGAACMVVTVTVHVDLSTLRRLHATLLWLLPVSHASALRDSTQLPAHMPLLLACRPRARRERARVAPDPAPPRPVRFSR